MIGVITASAMVAESSGCVAVCPHSCLTRMDDGDPIDRASDIRAQQMHVHRRVRHGHFRPQT